MKKAITTLMLSALLWPAVVLAEDTAGDTKVAEGKKEVLTYDNYIDKIRAMLPEIKTNIIQVQKSENRLHRARKVHDTTLTGSTQYYRKKEYTMGPSLFEMDHTEGYTAHAGIQRIIAPTGTRVSTGIDYSKTTMKGDITSQQKSMIFDAYQPSVSVSIVQPLLHNAFGILDRFAENDARMKLEIQKLQRQEDDRSVMNYYRKLYFHWLFYLHAIEIVDETIKNARSLENTVRRKAGAGLAENDNVQNAHSSVLQYRAQLQQYEMRLNSIEKELGIYLEPGRYTPDRNLIDKMFTKASDHNFKEVPFGATTGSRIIQKNIDNMKYVLDVKENSSLPSLNLVGSVTRKNYDETFPGAAEKLDDTDYSIGLEFSYPLGNHDAEADIHEARLALKELEKQYQASRNRYQKSLSEILQSIRGYRKVTSTREENLQALRSQLRTERKKYAQARLDLQFLITTENSIAREYLTLLEQRVELITLYIDYMDLTK